MKTVELETTAAACAWWAARDAQMRSTVNASHYSEAVKVRAERMRLVLELLYSAKNIYIAFGRRGISIKVDGALVRDRKALRALEADWAAEGIVKKISAQGVIYRLAA